MTIFEETKAFVRSWRIWQKKIQHRTAVVAIAMRFNLLNIECNNCASGKMNWKRTSAQTVDGDRQLKTLVLNEHERSEALKIIISKVCCVDLMRWCLILLLLAGDISQSLHFCCLFCFQALFGRRSKRMRQTHNTGLRSALPWFFIFIFRSKTLLWQLFCILLI